MLANMSTSLILIGLVSVLCLREIGFDAGKIFKLPSKIVWIVFLFIYPLSGLIHYFNLSNFGFYNFYSRSKGGHESIFLMASFTIFVAAISFKLGSVFFRKRFAYQSRTGSDLVINKKLFLLLGCLALVSFFGLIQLDSGKDLSEVVGAVERDGIASGSAKWFFLASWLPLYAIVANAIVLERKKVGLTFVFISSVLFVLVTLLVTFRTGGRAMLIVYFVTFITAILSRNWDRFKSIVTVLLFFVIFLVGLVTALRTDGDTDLGDGALQVFFEIGDWQAGRFSIIGAADEIVESTGFFNNSFFCPPLRLLDLLVSPLGVTFGSDCTDALGVLGEFFLGDRTFTGILAGLVSEFYMFGGLVAVFCGFLLVGFFVSFCENRIVYSGDSVDRLFWVFSLYLFAFISFSSTALNWIYYLATTGAPIVLLWIFRRPFLIKRCD